MEQNRIFLNQIKGFSRDRMGHDRIGGFSALSLNIWLDVHVFMKHQLVLVYIMQLSGLCTTHTNTLTHTHSVTASVLYTLHQVIWRQLQRIWNSLQVCGGLAWCMSRMLGKTVQGKRQPYLRTSITPTFFLSSLHPSVSISLHPSVSISLHPFTLVCGCESPS